MKIGLFSDDYLPRKSGVVTSLTMLKQGLEELGHTVYLIVPKTRDYDDKSDKVIRITSINSLVIEQGRLSIPFPRQVSQLANLELDVVHSHTSLSLGLTADYVARKSKIPHVSTVHTIWAETVKYYPLRWMSSLGFITLAYQLYFLKASKLKIPPLRQVASPQKAVLSSMRDQIWQSQSMFLNHCDAVTSPSIHLADQLIKKGLDKTPNVIPNGINIQHYSPPRKRIRKKDSLKVVCVGRLSYEKRQDVLIQSLTEASGVSLTLVGTGPAEKEHKKLAQELGVEDRVDFVGEKNYDQIKEYLHSSDVFALGSYHFDNQPMVLIEAGAAGLPIVYCDSNLSEGVSSHGSVKCSHTASGFSRAFRRLLKMDAEQLAAMGQENIKFTKKYDYLAVARQMEHLYQQTISRSA
jgi:glycosyltransferase involved in cell wall biosynthesis